MAIMVDYYTSSGFAVFADLSINKYFYNNIIMAIFDFRFSKRPIW